MTSEDRLVANIVHYALIARTVVIQISKDSVVAVAIRSQACTVTGETLGLDRTDGRSLTTSTSFSSQLHLSSTTNTLVDEKNLEFHGCIHCFEKDLTHSLGRRQKREWNFEDVP